jgi:hypothetical protein
MKCIMKRIPRAFSAATVEEVDESYASGLDSIFEGAARRALFPLERPDVVGRGDLFSIISLRCDYAQAQAPRIDASQPIHQPPTDAAAKGNQWFDGSLQGRCPLVSDQARPARACPSFGASEGRTARSESACAIDLEVLLRAAAARLKITGRTCRNLWGNT